MIRTIVVLLCLFFSVHATARKIRYYKIPYIIRNGDSYAKILKRFVKADSVILNSTPMVKKTQRSNPAIKNWKRLPSGKKINLYISTDFIDLNKYRRYRKQIRKKIVAAKKKLKEKSKGVKKKKSSPFDFLFWP